MIVRAWLLATLCLLSIFKAGSSFANDAENKIKAAFIYKFCSYVQWPDTTFSTPDSPIVIAVADSKSTYSDIASTVKGRKINSRSFRVVNIKSIDSLEGVHILYVGNNAKNTLESFVPLNNTLPILTVTADENMSPTSIVNFLIDNEHVRFDISQKRAANVGLKLSSELLAVARSVEKIEDISTPIINNTSKDATPSIDQTVTTGEVIQ